MQQRAGDSETKTDVAQPSMYPGSDPSRPSSIADFRKASFSITLTFAIDDRRLVIRLGCVDGWAASVLVSESVRSASLRDAADSLARFAKRFVRFRCPCCGVLVSKAAQLARRSRHGDPVFVI
ncbi:unnamed protein product [Sphagnum jensenii]|uniref:Uncharacterized protein n=1 Tax=Sphagnum jensenii TaxID=128206 RepID=A0ABP1C025_9BRYO